MDTLTEIKELLQPIHDFFYTLFHPYIIWNWFVDQSYDIALMVGTIAILLYVCGHKKALKYTFTSVLIFILIQMVGKVGV